MHSSESLGKTIKINRQKIGLTQKDLADKLFVSEKTISRWECGLGYPSLQDLEKLSEILQIDFNSFIGVSISKVDDTSERQTQLASKLICIFSLILFVISVVLLIAVRDVEAVAPLIYELFFLNDNTLLTTILSICAIAFVLIGSSLSVFDLCLYYSKKVNKRSQRIISIVRLLFDCIALVFFVTTGSIKASRLNLLSALLSMLLFSDLYILTIKHIFNNKNRRSNAILLCLNSYLTTFGVFSSLIIIRTNALGANVNLLIFIIYFLYLVLIPSFVIGCSFLFILKRLKFRYLIAGIISLLFLSLFIVSYIQFFIRKPLFFVAFIAGAIGIITFPAIIFYLVNKRINN